MKRVVVGLAMTIALGMGMFSMRAGAQEHGEYEGPMSNMHFVIVRDSNGKPIKNAAVVLHPVRKNGKQEMGGMELKTGDDGRAGIDGIPYGPLRVQVLAPGLQTFGEDYNIRQPETEITIRLKRPAKQYSIYGVQEKEKKPDTPKPQGSTAASDPQKPPDQKPQ